MLEYDFCRIFEPQEFQRFSRDMIQVREKMSFESFAEGMDLGIDGRHVSSNGETIIFQAKKLRNEADILKQVRKEKVKLDGLIKYGIQVTRYIIVFSRTISPLKKAQIKKILFPYVKNPADIVSGDDLNNWIDAPEYKEVKEKYFKLWLPNTDTLKHVLFETVNGPLVEKTRMLLDDALEKSAVFVETKAYMDALSKLKNNRVLLISGNPGIGKTTLAKQIGLFYFLKKKYENFFFVSSCDELFKLQSLPGKKVILFDDFWGDSKYDESRNGRSSVELINYIEYIQKKKDALLLITTREYILEQGLEKHEQFRTTVQKYKFVLEMDEYSDTDKLRIYFAHLKNHPLTWEQLIELEKIAPRVIYSRNYNPRVIDEFIKAITPEISGEKCQEQLIQYLDKPSHFWKKNME